MLQLFSSFKQPLLLSLLSSVGLLLSGLEVQAQGLTRVGDWQLHVPYRQGKAVVEANDKVYTVVEQGLFYYDKAFNSTEGLTKNDGLRDQNISAISYSEFANTLVIAYASTHLDLLRENEIVSISDIFRRSIPGEKVINSIYTQNKLAYLSSSFGIVVLDLVKQEIRDTYSNLGANGSRVNVRSTIIFNDSIYAATNAGVLAASLNASNLQDYRNWHSRSRNLPVAESPAQLTVFNGSLYVSTKIADVYKYNTGRWQATGFANGLAVSALTSSPDYLVITTASKVLLLNKQGNLSEVAPGQLPAPKQAIVGRDNKVWIADGDRGLVRLDVNGANTTAFAPEGPYAGTGFSMNTHNGMLYVFSGGYTPDYTPANNTNGFYAFRNGNWESYNQQTNAGFPAFKDIVRGEVQPATGNLYAASYSDGLLEWNSTSNTFTVYNAANSPLLATPNTGAVRVTDVAIDDAGKVWVVNRNQRQGQPGLFALAPDKTWQSFTLAGVADGTNLEHILIDDNGYKWLSISRQDNSRTGLVIYDETSQQVKYLSAGLGNGNLPDGNVYTMAKDLNGDIWVGTASGVGVFYNPGAVFSSSGFEGHIPIINRRPLLDKQLVRTIAIDGANRKWIGTDNGLWLFGPDGDEVIHHFTTQNSPLPSNKILSVAVEHKTGNVFIATDAGIASYRAGATITEGKPDCAVVFPNPVQRSYTGRVAISNLPNNAEVHITDIAGNLIYKTRAAGGTATWDVRDYNGSRAKAGVYLVLSSDADGNQTCISKIAVLQ